MCDLIYTSGDILNIVLAASIAIIAIVFAWGMFYIAMMLRGAFRVIRDIESIVKDVKEAISLAKAKAEAGTYLLKIVSKGVKDVIGVIEKKINKKDRVAKKKKITKKKK